LLLAHRELFAVTDGRKTIRGDSEINEVAFCALCSLCTQCEVVLVVSTLVTMPFDFDPDLRVRFQPRGVTLKYVLHIRANIVTIKVKVDVSERTFLSTFA
jgi:hypothetical protein